MQVTFYRGEEIVKSVEVETAENVFNCLPKELLGCPFGQTEQEEKEEWLNLITDILNGSEDELWESSSAFPNLQEEGLEGVDYICIEDAN